MVELPYVILLAEDNEHDIEATRRAWRKQNFANPLYIVNDGEECLDYLFRRGKYSAPDTAPRPGLLLLDLKMPKIGGLAVLEQVRISQELRNLPVVILTTSRLQIDRLKSYDLGANAYIRKPMGYQNYAEMLRIVRRFWELAERP